MIIQIQNPEAEKAARQRDITLAAALSPEARELIQLAYSPSAGIAFVARADGATRITEASSALAQALIDLRLLEPTDPEWVRLTPLGRKVARVDL